jgi:hypothetical protein
VRPVDVVITILLITGWSVVTETFGSPHSSGADDSQWFAGRINVQVFQGEDGFWYLSLNGG